MKRYSALLLILALLFALVFMAVPSKAQSAWQPGVAYSVGTLVTYGGHTYKCIQAHTSQVGWEPPNTPALWQDMGVTTGGSTNTPVPPSTNTPTFVPTTIPPTGSTGTGSNGSPYGGTAANLPGKVEAENFNTGGEGVAYHDAEAANQGGQYRTSEGVDIEATTDTGGGFDVGWTATGEWEKYTVNVTTAGTYSIDFRVASAQAGAGLHLEIDGNNVTGTMAVPNTGGWQTWTTITKTGVSFSAGSHVLRLFVDTTGYNINWFNVYGGSATAIPTKTNTPMPTATTGSDGSPFSGSPYAIPGKVEAENYNTGGEGVAYHDADTTNNGGQYRTGDGVDIEATTDTGGGYNVGWTAAAEWMKYTVNVTAGTYNIDFRVASNQAGGSFHLEVDNSNVTGSLTVPNTGGWQTWTTVTASNISLSGGQHVFKWATDAAGGNYNWFNVYKPGSVTNTPIPSNTPTNVPSNGTLPRHLITGYWQDFTGNGATALRLSAVPNTYALIAVAFANATGTPGQISFSVDSGLSSALGGYTDANFISDINTLHSQGRKVIVSVGGQNGTISVSDSTSAANFANSAYSIIQQYGFDGVDIDLENGINPQFMASALQQLSGKVGPNLIITLAPQTIDMQSTSSGYFQLALNIKSILTIVNMQYYNSGSMNGCNGNVYSEGGVDFLTALACIQLQGGLRPDQIGLGLPANSSGAGNGAVAPSVVNAALDCLELGTNCGSFHPSTTYSGIRGAMDWDINWDANAGYNFANTVSGHFSSLP